MLYPLWGAHTSPSSGGERVPTKGLEGVNHTVLQGPLVSVTSLFYAVLPKVQIRKKKPKFSKCSIKIRPSEGSVLHASMSDRWLTPESLRPEKALIFAFSTMRILEGIDPTIYRLPPTCRGPFGHENTNTTERPPLCWLRWKKAIPPRNVWRFPILRLLLFVRWTFPFLQTKTQDGAAHAHCDSRRLYRSLVSPLEARTERCTLREPLPWRGFLGRMRAEFSVGG